MYTAIHKDDGNDILYYNKTFAPHHIDTNQYMNITTRQELSQLHLPGPKISTSKPNLCVMYVCRAVVYTRREHNNNQIERYFHHEKQLLR